jgi:RNA polymerase sigma-70 factor, ECF subfamily
MSGQEEPNLVPSYPPSPDGRATSQDPNAWDDFFLAHDPLIQSVVKKCARCRAEFDDVCQEVRLALSQELPGFRLDPARGTLHGWIATVARRVARRRSEQMSKHPTEALTEESAARLRDPRPGPPALLVRRRERARLRAILDQPNPQIPERSRRIIIMHYIEGRSLAQIALELGLSVHCVEMRLSRALKRLHDLLSRNGFEPA